MSEARVLHAEVAIVGAGPGGLAAAVELVRQGLSVLVLDEGQQPGGQIFRQLPPGAAALPGQEPPSHQAGHGLLAAATAHAVPVHHGATVWNVAPGRLWFEQHGQSWLVCCRHLVLATGAFDRCVPFPGWTLPGVTTAGALQVMVRGYGVVPGRRALVVGSGPLLLPTVATLHQAGVEVVAALEASSRWRALRALPAVLTNAARRREALWYARGLLRAGVRLRWGWTVFACEGDGRVQRAVIGKVDAEGNPRRGSERRLEVDVVGAGFGLVPSIELGQLLGCRTRYDAPRGGHCLEVDGQQATSVAGVYAVGEACGVGGAEVAMAEGRLAAAAIVAAVRQTPIAAALRTRVAAERRAADAMLRAFAPLPGLHRLATDDTLVCRCEDVPLARARAAAALHGDSLRAIKVGCRAGMGPCQGRICGSSLQALATGRFDVVPDLPVAQVPAKPVRSATIVDAPEPPATA
ncbi:MAG: FAD-dependent oxidoreductase [Planctomycetes bacterium]|nr:FAD-dependent oxidoreductase [Planctomycetota bacterium]